MSSLPAAFVQLMIERHTLVLRPGRSLDTLNLSSLSDAVPLEISGTLEIGWEIGILSPELCSWLNNSHRF